jgi:hypothetical protein
MELVNLISTIVAFPELTDPNIELTIDLVKNQMVNNIHYEPRENFRRFGDYVNRFFYSNVRYERQQLRNLIIQEIRTNDVTETIYC